MFKSVFLCTFYFTVWCHHSFNCNFKPYHIDLKVNIFYIFDSIKYKTLSLRKRSKNHIKTGAYKLLTLRNKEVKHSKDNSVAAEHVVTTRVHSSQSHPKTAPDGYSPLQFGPHIPIYLEGHEKGKLLNNVTLEKKNEMKIEFEMKHLKYGPLCSLAVKAGGLCATLSPPAVIVSSTPAS